MSDIQLFKSLIILSLGVFLLPKQWKIIFCIALQAGIVLITTGWAFAAWNSNHALIIDLGISFWGGSPLFVIDGLSAFFTLIVNLTSLTGLVYGAGYLKPYFKSKSGIAISLHLCAFLMLHVSMLHVVMVREGFAFLMAWEVMSVSSFVLVIFDGQRDDNLEAGVKYLVQMHVCFTLLLLAFLWVAHSTGKFGFDGLAIYFQEHDNKWIFLILFAAFAIKAGFVPLHTWLPHAHPAAPSHVSGVMSGVMIKMGIYGILRVLIDLQNGFLVLGLVVLVLSVVTALVGIIYSSFQNDLKKLLAYSSIENIGIIGIGLGIAMLGRYSNNSVLTTLGFAGALLHVANHSLYKSLLFYSAGNVYYTTHTRNLNKLGGLMQAMPVSGALFLIGVLCICAIPPFSGFISEFALYMSVIQTIGTADFTTSLMILVVMLALVVIGGISVMAFTKAFGISFLGTRRGHARHRVQEVPWIMLIPGFVIIVSICGISIFSPWVLVQIGQLGTLFQHLEIKNDVLDTLKPVFANVSFVSAILVGVTLGVYLVRKALMKKDPHFGPTWGCGYSAGDFRHQYTSSSYGHYVRELVSRRMELRGARPFAEDEIFPGPRTFETKIGDVVEERLITRPVEGALRQMSKAGWAQTGLISHYLAYPLAFLLIITLLTLLGAI